MDTALTQIKEDEKYMLEAISLSEKGRVTAPPNPWVGCVIVKNGKIVGRGYHIRSGEPHAEIYALEEAKEHANGAEIYVTLEPCSHYGRTPPCANALIQAKPKRVIVSLADPDQKVNGRGLNLLKDAGIHVTQGILADKTATSLRPYIHHRQQGTPYVVAKCAMSLDGKIAAKDGSSQWISSEEARLDAHKLRSQSQAILIGVETAIQDQPRLTVRHPEALGASPLKVILDPKGRLSQTGPLFEEGNVLIVTQEKSFSIHQKNVEILSLPKEKFLPDLLQNLGGRGVLQLLVEGGGKTLGSFLEQNLIHEHQLYYGPLILGDKGISSFGGLSLDTMAKSHRFYLHNLARLGDTVKMTLNC